MRRSGIIIVIALAVVAVGGGIGAALVLPGLRAKPDPVAREYLGAWERGDYAAMARLVEFPPPDFAQQHANQRTDLRVDRARFQLGQVTTQGSTRATAPFTVTLAVRGFGNWSYQSQLQLSKPGRFGRDWRIDWSPASIHPDLGPGQRFEARRSWSQRGSILAGDGSVLAGPEGSTSGLGSLTDLLGSVKEADRKALQRLGAPYQSGDEVGAGGLEQTFERQLAGSPTREIRLVDENGDEVKVLRRLGGKAGEPLRTTIDPRMQAAAEQALGDLGGKNGALVAVQPSTGAVRAMVSRPYPGFFQRATLGRYPPGSTFKVVTAAALLGKGLRTSERIQCTKDIDVGGVTIHNFEDEAFGNIPFNQAFAHSCNTAFVRLATQRLSGSELAEAAGRFGFGAALAPGIPAETSRFPVPQSPPELAMAGFGQARVTASPLEMASVAATVQSGTWRAPRVVDEAALAGIDAKQPPPRQLDPGVANTLRDLMRQVVTEGTAKGANLPGGVAGKTGTAEFGEGQRGEDPPTHAWFIAFRGDLAISVIVEDGGVGGEVAAPIAGRFFRSLGA